MSFQFTFIGFKYSKNSPTCKSSEKETMAKRKLTPPQKKFKTAVQSCHGSTDSKESFGKCMSEKLSSGKSKRKKRKLESTISRKYAKELEKKYGKKIYTKSKSGLRIVD